MPYEYEPLIVESVPRWKQIFTRSKWNIFNRLSSITSSHVHKQIRKITKKKTKNKDGIYLEAENNFNK